MAKFLVTNEGQGINLALLEHFEVAGSEVLLRVGQRSYTTSPDVKMTIKDLSDFIATALTLTAPVVQWDAVLKSTQF